MQVFVAMNSVIFTSFALIVVFGFLMLYEMIPSKEKKKPLSLDYGDSDVLEVGSLSKAYDEDCEICIRKEPGKFHMVTSFFPVTNPQFGNTMDDKYVDEPLDTEGKFVFLNKRVQELIDALEKKLKHNLITAVHVVYNHPAVMSTILRSRVKNAHKLIFHPLKCKGQMVSFKAMMEYIQSYLLNVPIIFTNQDTYIGDGFDQLNLETMQAKGIAYALTRSGRRERYCEMAGECRRGEQYMGSHDSYVFILTKKLKKKTLLKIDFKLDDFGAENVFIHFLTTVLKMKVLNPCFRLRTFHVHCIKFHNKNRPRINNKGKSAWIPFTDLLE